MKKTICIPNQENQCNRNQRIAKFKQTSFDPDVLAELGGHAEQKSLTALGHSLMEVIAIASQDLEDTKSFTSSG